jgi:hypothetical protein
VAGGESNAKSRLVNVLCAPVKNCRAVGCATRGSDYAKTFVLREVYQLLKATSDKSAVSRCGVNHTNETSPFAVAPFSYSGASPYHLAESLLFAICYSGRASSESRTPRKCPLRRALQNRGRRSDFELQSCSSSWGLSFSRWGQSG